LNLKLPLGRLFAFLDLFIHVNGMR
jgi:hypothetical protein